MKKDLVIVIAFAIIVILLRVFGVIDNVVLMSGLFAGLVIDWIRLIRENSKLTREITRLKEEK